MSLGKRFLCVLSLVIAVFVGIMFTIWVFKAVDRQHERQLLSIEESIRSGENQADLERSAIQQEAEFRNTVFIDVSFINKETEENYDLIINGVENPRNALFSIGDKITVQINDLKSGKIKTVDIKKFLKEEDIHLKAGDILELLQSGNWTYVFVTKKDNGDFHTEKARMEI